jgi:hypothetical protein
MCQQCVNEERARQARTATPAKVVNDKLEIVASLPLLYPEDVTTRDDAMATIRRQVEKQQREIDELKAQAARDREENSATINRIYRENDDQVTKLRKELRAARTKASNVKFVATVVQQLSRLLGGTELTFDGPTDEDGYEYVVSGDNGFTATVNTRYYSLVVGNKSRRLKERTLSVNGDGLDGSTVTAIAGMFGVSLTPGNTPKSLHDELFDLDSDSDESSMPAGLRNLLGRIGISFVEVG